MPPMQKFEDDVKIIFVAVRSHRDLALIVGCCNTWSTIYNNSTTEHIRLCPTDLIKRDRQPRHTY